MVQYLTAEDIARFNAAFVGEDVPFDFGLLESAAFRPQTTIGGVDTFPNIHERAAALMHALIRNHPFLDGNKRTAVSAIYVFYRLNGSRLVLDQGEVVALAVDIAEGELSVAEIAKALTAGTREEPLGPGSG